MNVNPSPQNLSPAGRKTFLRIAIVSSFLPSFMGSALNIALPEIGRAFSLSAVSLGWVQSIYLLATAVALVPIGRIADLYGRRRIFLAGCVIFSLMSLLCAMAPSVTVLILARGGLGLGAAMIFATITAMLTAAFPHSERGRVLGINIAAVYVGLSSGPVLGGLMTEYFGWRSIFATIVPLGLWLVWAVQRHFDAERPDAEGEGLDLPGMLLYGVGTATLMYGLSRIPSNHGLILTAAGSICLIGFMVFERRAASPVMDVRLFISNRVFLYSNLAALIHYSATFAVGFLLSLYLQIVRDLSAATAGMLLIAQPLVQALFSPLAGRLSDRMEPRVIASAGMALTGVGLLALIPIHDQTPIWMIVCILCVQGFGFALFASPNTNAIMSSVDRSRYGLASGALATMRQIGQMLSMTLAMMVFFLLIGSDPLTKLQSPLLLRSMSTLLTIMAVLCALGVFASLARGNLHKPGSVPD